MAQVQVYDRDNQVWVPAQDTDVTDMVASGKFGLQTGIDIPVTFADGTMGTVPSDNFEEGATKGDFRFQTKGDLDAYEQQQKSAILQKNFGSAGQAALAGGMRGFTFGLSDIGMQGMAALEGKNPDDVKSGLNALQTNSPVASAAGEIGGMALNPFAGELRAAGEAGGAAVGEMAANAGAGSLAQGMASSIAGTALEGGFWGVGQGVSEASLGNPDEVAQNLVAGPTMGVLFGGAFGAGFGAIKEASPFFKSAINRVSNAGEDLVQSVLSRGTEAAINVVPNVAEMQAFRQAAGPLAHMPEVLDMYFSKDGPEKLQQVLKQSAQLEKDLTNRAENLKTGLYKSISDLPETVQNQVMADFQSSSGDLGSALESGAARLEANRQVLNTAMLADQTPGEMFMETHDAVESAIKTLEQTRDLRAKSIAKELQNRLDGEKAARGLYVTVGEDGKNVLSQGTTTAGSEAILSDELQNITGRGLDSTRLPLRARTVLEGLHDDLGEMTRGNPVFGEHMTKLQDMREAYGALREFVTGVAGESTNVKSAVIKSIITDPRKARDLDTMFSNLSEYMPEFQAYRDSANNAATRMNALREASSKLDGMRNKMFERTASIDDIQNIFDSFQDAPKNIGEKISELRQVQTALNQSDPGAVSKFMRLSSFMGNEVSPDITKLQKFEGAYETLDKLRAANAQKDPISSLATKIAVGRIARKVGRWVGGPVVGEAVGAAADLVANKGLNTYNTLKTLNTLSKANRMSGRLLRAVTEKAVNAMTGASKIAGPAAGALGEKYLKEVPRPLSAARKDFKQRAEYLTKLTSDPDYMASEAQKRIAGLEHAAPMLAATLSKQFSGTAYYLADSMPKDPTLGRSLNLDPTKSTWEPSDKDLMSWERRVSTAENPARAIAAIADGKMSRESIETLQALHPVAFGKLQQGVNDAIMNGDTKLTYAQKMQIGQLLGVRADPSLDPSFVQAMQANMSAQGPGAPPQGPRGPYKGGVYPSRLNLDTDATGTETTRVTNA
jgi:hypothetical protein